MANCPKGMAIVIYEVHRKAHNNVGDAFCNPSRYFNFGNCKSGELVGNKFPITDQTVLIGGGGLIHKQFSLNIQALLEKKPTHAVLWGVGHNFGKKHVRKSKQKVYYPPWVFNCSLIGIRDYLQGYYNHYLPCVSCMHPAFEKKYNTTREYVYFLHAYKTKFGLQNTNVPFMKNNEMDFEKVIDFLGSAETVISDSYHGIYWAQLLGKNTQAVSWSVKFNHMKYPPYFLKTINTAPKRIKNRVDGFLAECRNYNNDFYKKFMNL